LDACKDTTGRASPKAQLSYAAGSPFFRRIKDLGLNLGFLSYHVGVNGRPTSTVKNQRVFHRHTILYKVFLDYLFLKNSNLVILK